MLHATSHCHHDSRLPVGTITLDHRGRHLRRKRLITDQGDIVMIDLPEAVLLADGDALVLKDGRTLTILAAPEELYAVRAGRQCPLAHLAWHLGNRHLAAEIGTDVILIERDPVIRTMLQGLGAEIQEVVAGFQPVHGAYHGHAHGHDHGHGHD
ncbi:urease accessory protein UreE [Labrys sp. ZIDIC5]|uniref:urease accessory protein UreE n=1 Tax=Labrys sedimenti TaxID=3106036 RepID=UPI002ACA4384|nr:urease accessory protein UreE [Labrys sp. ZIDIC5]MDZ5453736.1 urease accessory protein UreE [Labrys sp. ZIDIC5]